MSKHEVLNVTRRFRFSQENNLYFEEKHKLANTSERDDYVYPHTLGEKR